MLRYVAESISSALFLMLFCSTFTPPVYANGDVVADVNQMFTCKLSGSGDTIRCELQTMITGFEVRGMIRILNDTKHSWSGIQTVGSCGCAVINSSKINTVPVGESADFEFKLLPKDERSFLQKIEVFASFDDQSDSKPLASILFKARVVPAVSCSPVGFEVTKISEGLVRCDVLPGMGEIRILWDDISSGTDGIRVTVPRNPFKSAVEIQLIDASLVNLEGGFSAIVRIPFRLRNKEETYLHEASINFYPRSPIKVIPTTIVMPKEFEQLQFKAVVNDRRYESSEDRKDLSVFLVEVDESTSSQIVSEVSWRVCEVKSKTMKIVEVTLSKETFKNGASKRFYLSFGNESDGQGSSNVLVPILF
jgi:hypothetical protein